LEARTNVPECGGGHAMQAVCVSKSPIVFTTIVIQSVQFINEGRLDQLIEAEGAAANELIFRMVSSEDRSKQNLQDRQFARRSRLNWRLALVGWPGAVWNHEQGFLHRSAFPL
jgi:hypothetical protein